MLKDASILTGLYGITDSALMPEDQLLPKAEAAIRGGCRILQYRDKSVDRPNEQLAHELKKMCARYSATFLINDHIELARAVEADGVHVGQRDAAVTNIRQQYGDDWIIGVSCHDSLELAMAAQQQGASYVAFGRFFESKTKPDAPPATVAILSAARQQLSLPIVAIGGITRDNARPLREAGVDMLAVIHDLFSAESCDEVEERARIFAHLFINQTSLT